MPLTGGWDMYSTTNKWVCNRANMWVYDSAWVCVCVCVNVRGGGREGGA